MKPIHERAKEKAEKSKHYATARNHMVNAGGYFALFLASVVVDHVVDEFRARKSAPKQSPDADAQEEKRPGLFDRILAGM